MNQLASPKDILIVSHYYPPHYGGIEKVAQNQACRLATRGYNVTVVSSKTASDQLSGTFEGVHVRRVLAWNGLEKHGIAFPLFAPRLLPLLWHEVGDADVVHVHDVFYLSSLVAAACAFLRHRPLVLTQHVDLVPHPSRFVNFVEQLVYATSGAFIFHASQRVTVLNERVLAFVQSHGASPDKIMLLPNGTDCKLFSPATVTAKKRVRRQFGLPVDASLVLFSGRAVPKKGYDKVLAAQNDRYVLVFAGGEFTQKDSKQTKFLGMMPQERLAQVYKAADVFILPSSGEGFPLAVQEAMACGLPTLVLDDPIYDGFTDDQLYKLAKAAPRAIEAALLALLADAPLRKKMTTNARQYALAHFSWDDIVTRLENVYREASAAYGTNYETT